MSFYDAIRVGASAAADDFEVERSLRFDDGSSHYLTRTPSSVGNRKTFTFSFWVKRGNLGGSNKHMFAIQIDSSNQFVIRFVNTDKLQIYDYQSASMQMIFDTNAVFRDVSAWYHIVVAVDTTQSTNTNRFKLYVNGSQVTSFSSSTYPSQNHDTIVNTTNAHDIGQKNSSLYFDGYLAEFNFIDGQQLTPSSFAETNATTGQWMPIDTGNLTFGTNGFTLNFSDNSSTTASTLGKDTSGNGNNFTPNNFGATAHDQLKDTPTNNFATMSPLAVSGDGNHPTFSQGNLKTMGPNSGIGKVGATFGLSSGKWYVEAKITQGGSNLQLGIIFSGTNYANNEYLGSGSDYAIAADTLNKKIRKEGSDNQTSLGGMQNGDILAFAIDMDNGTFQLYNNGSTKGSQVSFTVANYAPVTFAQTTGADTGGTHWNFGADSSFAGAETAQGNTDANGQGDFYYSPPSGFLAVCSANLPDPTILLPNKHFDTVLYTGNGSSQTISGLNFAPDWVWIKVRNSSSGRSHILTDRVRGATKSLLLPETDAETTQPQDLTAFTSDGFSVGSNERVNENSKNLVAWNWDAGETDSATYRVVVVSDSGNKYRFRNSANTATFAQSAVTLDLAEGGTYTFDQSDSTMSSHPMKLSTTANGTHGGGSSYNTGVTYELDGSTVTESAFVSGFSSATSRKLIITVAASAPTLYYYCHYHSGMGGAINTNSTLGSSNFDGDAQTTVKVNTTAGFSIVTFTDNYPAGTGTYGLGHGLGVKPAFYVVKSRNHANAWWTWHQEYSNQAQGYQFLNATNAVANSVTPWGNSAPDSSKFYIKEGGFNYQDDTFVAYCFSEVAGYSKFGSYEGNQNADGPFVYLGFTPAWIIIKNIDNGTNRQWCIIDATRTTFNKSDSAEVLFSTSFGAESVANNNFGQFSSKAAIDILSNGFKVREGETAAYTQLNRNNTHIYLAFAKSPFKNSRAM